MDDLAKRRLLELFGLVGDGVPKPEYERLPLREVPLEPMARALNDAADLVQRLRYMADDEAPIDMTASETARKAADELDRWEGRALSAEAEIERLRAQLAALDRDAERYRWLRARTPGGKYRIAGLIYSDGDAHFDAAIDAAMAKAER